MVNQTAIVVMDWTDVQQIPERRSIFPVIQQLDVDLTVLLQSCSDLGDGRRGCGCALKKPAIASKYLTCPIAREVQKSLVR